LAVFLFQGSLCLLDIDQNDIQLPQEIPELPGRPELIKELTEIAQKYGFTPPQGSIRLRHEISKSQEIINFNSSDETEPFSGSDLDNSMNASTTGTWPRKKTYNVNSTQSPNNSLTDNTVAPSPMIGRRMAADSSPSAGRNRLAPSNWAGEEMPKIHQDPSADTVKLRRTESEEFLDDDADDDEDVDELDSTNDEVNNSPEKLLNPRLAAYVAIAEKAGINTSEIIKEHYKTRPTTDLTKKEDLVVYNSRSMTVTRKQQHENEFNIAVREIFVNRFTQMLVDYEQFVILPRQTKDDWFNNRDQMQNFDKAAFLSDQSESILPFMTLFVETQGFASLIDMKIMALWDDCDPRLAYFDKRIDKLKVKLGIIRSSIYEKCTSIPSASKIFIHFIILLSCPVC